MFNLLNHGNIFVAGFLVLFGSGCLHTEYLSLNRTWETNRIEGHRVGVVCENATSNACYIFTGYAARANDSGVVTIIDEDNNVIQFVNMSCVIAPADQIGDDACVIDVMPDLD